MQEKFVLTSPTTVYIAGSYCTLQTGEVVYIDWTLPARFFYKAFYKNQSIGTSKIYPRSIDPFQDGSNIRRYRVYRTILYTSSRAEVDFVKAGQIYYRKVPVGNLETYFVEILSVDKHEVHYKYGDFWQSRLHKNLSFCF